MYFCSKESSSTSMSHSRPMNLPTTIILSDLSRLDITRDKMATNRGIAKEKRKYTRSITEVIQNSDTVHCVLFETPDSNSNLESKSKWDADENAHAFPNRKLVTSLTCTTNVGPEEEIVSSNPEECDDPDNDENSDGCPRIERIMVPSGEYLIWRFKDEESSWFPSFARRPADRHMIRCSWIRLSDPSEWNSGHVASWISWCNRTFSLKLKLTAASVLPSSGKRLLELSLRDWQDIAGETAGCVLARHLGHLRLQATGVHIPDLLQENRNNGKWIRSRAKNE